MKESVQPHAQAALPPGKDLALNRRLGRSQSWSGCVGGEKHLLLLLGFTPQITKACHSTDYIILAHRYPGDWKDIMLHQFSLEKHYMVPGDEDTEKVLEKLIFNTPLI
jgi:hypothetical protein